MTPAELKEKRYRTEVCITCGKEWNVSRRAKLPKGGYICPHCRRRRDIKKTAATCATMIGLTVFGLACWIAYIERGYIALGGECLFLLFPIWGVGMYISLLKEYVCGWIKRQCRPIKSLGDPRTALWIKGCVANHHHTTTLYHNEKILSTVEREHNAY